SQSGEITVTVNVSNARLIRLNVERVGFLMKGTDAQLRITGDFEDEKGVVLPASYFTFVTSDGAVAQVSADGKVHGIGRGAAVIRASSHGITAADSVYVSTSLVEGALLNSAEQVFDVYPGAVTLIEGVGRRQVVIDANMHGNDSTAASGTVYIMQDTTVATVT